MKRFLCLVLAVALSAVLFAAAGCNQEEQTPALQPVVLRSFEEYNPDFMTLKMSRNFGEISVNTDKKYVAKGKQSAKFNIRGGYYHTQTPSVNMPFFSSLAGYNYKELSKYESVGMQVYNDETFDIPMYWNFTFFDGQASPRNTVVLKSGWNDVSLKIDCDILNMFYDLKNCNGLTLEFDDYSLDEEGNYVAYEDTPTIYVDEVMLYPSPTEYTAPEVDIVLDPYEICKFEKAYQAYILKPDSDNGFVPETSIVREDNGVIPTEGMKMLKATFPKGSGGYARLSFSAKLSDKINWAQYIDHVNEYCIAYDAFNATNTQQSLATYYIWGGVKEWPDPNLNWGINMEATNTSLPMSQWITYRMPLSTVYEWDERTLKEEMHMFMMFNDDIPEGGSVYFDNFRIEKI